MDSKQMFRAARKELTNAGYGIWWYRRGISKIRWPGRVYYKFCVVPAISLRKGQKDIKWRDEHWDEYKAQYNAKADDTATVERILAKHLPGVKLAPKQKYGHACEYIWITYDVCSQ